jgi:type II secretory pathway component PulF
MLRLAVYYENEVDTRVAGIATLIEPIVIVLLGIGIGFLVVAILLPIYQISTAIN